MQTIYFIDGEVQDGAGKELNKRAVLNRVNKAKKTTIAITHTNLSNTQIDLLLSLDNTCFVAPMVGGKISSSLVTCLDDGDMRKDGKALYRVLDMINGGSFATGVNRIHPAKRTWNMLQRHGGSVKAMAHCIKSVGDGRVYLAKGMLSSVNHCATAINAAEYYIEESEGPNVSEQVNNFLQGKAWEEWIWVAALLGIKAKERLTTQANYIAQYINKMPVAGNALEQVIISVIRLMMSDWLSRLSHPELFCSGLLKMPNGDKFQGFEVYEKSKKQS